MVKRAAGIAVLVIGSGFGIAVFGFGMTITLGESLPTFLVLYKAGAPVARGQIAETCYPQNVVDFARMHKVNWFAQTRIHLPGRCPSGDGHVAKIVAAVAGDLIVIDRQGVYVNGTRFPMSAPSHPEIVQRTVRFGVPFMVAKGYVMLLGWDRDSVDSRYFGAFPESVINGRITPVWPASGIFALTNKDTK